MAVTYKNQSGVLSLPCSLHCRMEWMLAASYTLVMSLGMWQQRNITTEEMSTMARFRSRDCWLARISLNFPENKC